MCFAARVSNTFQLLEFRSSRCLSRNFLGRLLVAGIALSAALSGFGTNAFAQQFPGQFNGNLLCLGAQCNNSNTPAAPAIVTPATGSLGAIYSQTIYFTSTPAVAVNNTFTVTAKASSDLPVYYVSLTPDVCSFESSYIAVQAISHYPPTSTLVTLRGFGTCTIGTAQDGIVIYNPYSTSLGWYNYKPAAQVTQSFVIYASQTITFASAPTVAIGTAGTVSATATSGLPVTYSSLTPSICSANGSTINGSSIGTCTIAADQAGNGTYSSAPRATQSFAIVKIGQSVSFGAAPAIATGGVGTVSAAASSSLAVTLGSSTPGVCSISGNTVTGITPGACFIFANQAGNANYSAAAQVTQSLTIGNQTLSFGAAPAIVSGGTGTITAMATSSLAVTFTSIAPSVCSVSGSTVSGIAAGACIIAANQSGNANYVSAAQVTQSFIIGKANQSISFGAAPTVVAGGVGSVSGNATSNLAVSFTSTTPAICSINGSTVTGIAAGTCTIAANQAGNANYNAAALATLPIAIGKGNQTVSFGAAPMILIDGVGTVSATASSNLSVGFTSNTPGTCSVNGSTVTGIAVGTCTIAANQAGNANYNAAAAVTQPILVGKGNQTLSFGTAPAIQVGGIGLVSATATSGLAVSFTSATASVCAVSGSTVTGIAVGTCTIAADQAGNSSYNAAARVTQAIGVQVGIPGAPTVGAAIAGNGSATINFIPPTNDGGSAVTAYTATCGSQTGSNSINPVTVMGLTNGATYNCSVTATNSTGTSAASGTVSVIPRTVPGAPGIGTAKAGNASATVSFTAPNSNGGSEIVTYTATSNPAAVTGTGTASPISVTGLTNGKTYTFTVTATNSVGTGSASAASNIIAPAADAAAPTIPTGLTASATSATQINLRWTAATDNAGVTGYKVYRGGVLVGRPATTSFADAGLTGLSTYSYTIASCDAAGNCSVPSTPVSATTWAANAIPAAPQTPAAQSLIAGWNLVGNNSSSAIDPIAIFGNTTAPIDGISAQITTVWQWDAASSKWMFFTPSFGPPELASYATGKGYGVMSSIASGEGYWVNAKAPITITLPGGTGQTTSRPLIAGWNLAGNNAWSAINPIVSFGNATTPVNGVSDQITSVWQWDAANSKWMFFTPSFGAPELATYAAGKGYGVVSSIASGEGYWVNAKAPLSGTQAPICASPQVLQNGVCVTLATSCTSPQVLQNGVCVSPATNCASPQVLQNGLCVLPPPNCTAPLVLESGVCIATPTLTVSTTGAGAGTVYPASGNYPHGATLVVTAASDMVSDFRGWTTRTTADTCVGSIYGCEITMDKDYLMEARFEPALFYTNFDMSYSTAFTGVCEWQVTWSKSKIEISYLLVNGKYAGKMRVVGQRQAVVTKTYPGHSCSGSDTNTDATFDVGYSDTGFAERVLTFDGAGNEYLTMASFGPLPPPIFGDYVPVQISLDYTGTNRVGGTYMISVLRRLP